MSNCESFQIEPTSGSSEYFNKSAENELLASSHPIDETCMQSDFTVPAMHCVSCIRTLEKDIGKLPFVTVVRANLSLKKVSVTWHKGAGNILKIDKAITDAGFEHELFDLQKDTDNLETDNSKRLLLALAVAAFAAINIMLLSISVWSGADLETAKLFHLISGLIALPAVIYSGQPFFHSAFNALKVGRLNMDVPISLAVLLALGMSIYEALSGGAQAYFDAAVTLLFFLLIGRYLDNLMRDKARSSLAQLAKLSAKGALQVDGENNLSYLKLEEITPGMIIRIMAGERVAVDGEVIKGQSDMDRSLVTGESVPQLVKPGSQVEAGNLNLTGSIDIRVMRDAKNSFLGEVTAMMLAAEKGRGNFTRIADKMAQIYAPAVHLLAALSFIGWMWITNADWHNSIYVAISVLIITCPCALGLAVPVVHVIAARRLFNQGILIRDGSAFERLEQINHIIFDKTGTLTSPMPAANLLDKISDENAAILKSLASHSSHPFSRAITKLIEGSNLPVLENIKEFPGCGIEATYDNKIIRLGRIQWIEQILKTSIDIFDDVSIIGFAVTDKNQTANISSKITRVQLSEAIREDAPGAINELKARGLKIEILSGDAKYAVKKLADNLKIDRYFHDLKPADKVAHINQFKQRNKKILMVGDGLNDSPALVAAHVSIAPSNASDIARNCADLVFTRPSLDAVPYSINIAKFAGRLVRQNFALAIAYNAIAIPFAMAGYVTPLIAAIAMSASSIVVVANSMRLNLDIDFHQYRFGFQFIDRLFNCRQHEQMRVDHQNDTITNEHII